GGGAARRAVRRRAERRPPRLEREARAVRGAAAHSRGPRRQLRRRSLRVGRVGLAEPLPPARSHALSAAIRSSRGRDRGLRDRRNDMTRARAIWCLAGLFLTLGLALG